MRQDSQAAHKIKTQITAYTQELTITQKRPTAKFVFQMLYGIVASGSLHLSKIGRCVQGEETLLATIKRFSRQLRVPQLGRTLQQVYVEQMGAHVTSQTVLAVDISDIVKPYAEAMEYLGRVYDGSTKETHEPGYNFIEVTAVTHERVLPLYGRLYSNVAPDWRSENAHMLEAFAATRQATGGEGIFVIDRGGDRPAFFADFFENSDDFVVRLTGKRLLVRQHDGRVLLANPMAREVNFTHTQTIEVEKDGVREEKILRYGSVRVRLAGFLQYRLWLVVIDGSPPHGVMLLTNLPSAGELVLQRAANYLLRWRCEEEIRFLKQGFDLEDVRVLKYDRLQNMMVFAVLAMGFLSRVGYLATRLCYLYEKILQKSKRIFSIPKFRYYALLDGIRFYLAAYRGRVSFPRQLRLRTGQLSLFAFPENFG